MITLGDKQLVTQRPADLDAALVASTGCTAAENARFAARGSASQLARAAMPFLSEPPVGGVFELAAMIDDANLVDVRRQVVALLTKPSPQPTPDQPDPQPIQQPAPAPVIVPGATA